MRWKNLDLVVLLFFMWLLIWTVADVSLPRERVFIRDQGNLDGRSTLLTCKVVICQTSHSQTEQS